MPDRKKSKNSSHVQARQGPILKKWRNKWGILPLSFMQAYGINLEDKFVVNILFVLLGFGISKTYHLNSNEGTTGRWEIYL